MPTKPKPGMGRPIYGHRPDQSDPTRQAIRFRLPLPIESLFWGGVCYGLVRVVPHVAGWLTNVPMVTDNHTVAVSFACGIAAGIFACGKRIDRRANPR